MAWPVSPTTLPNQWTLNELVDAVKMNARVDAQLNALLAYINGNVRFFGSFLTAGTITANTNVDFTGHIVEDTSSGWNSTSKYWVAPVVGTYMISAQLKTNTTGAPVVKILKNGSAYYLGGAVSSVANAAGQTPPVYMRCAAGDQISIQCLSGFTTQIDSPAHSSFLQITQESYV